MEGKRNYCYRFVCHIYHLYMGFLILIFMGTSPNYKNLNPIEKIKPSPILRYEEVYAKDVENVTDVEKKVGYKVTYSNFDENNGCLNWNLYNFSSDNEYFALLRGTNLVPPYWFLEYYTEVYKAFGIVQFLKSGYLRPDFDYTIGLIDYDDNGNRNYAGVFYVPESTQLTLEECGFSTNNMPTIYKLVPVQYLETKKYLVEYNYMEIIDYTLQTGTLVPDAPFPLYQQEVAKFRVSLDEGWINQRKFMKMNWITSFIYKHL